MRKITLGTLNISDQGKQWVNDILNTNRLSYGRYTRRFEREFANLHGCRHGIFMNSGTSALQVALACLKEVHGYQDGDEVIVPATTFIATSNIVLQNNLKPVFVDVDPYTFNINPYLIERAITPRTRCIIPVHLFGLPADMTEIQNITEERGLQIIEDSCETMFAYHCGKMVGSMGDLGCFSTYVAHLIVGGIGGIITTNNDQLMRICRSLMQHGRDSIYTDIDQDDNASDSLLKQMIERRYKFDRLGYSYRATEIEAAISLSELRQWESHIEIRRRNAQKLTEKLWDLSYAIQLPEIPKDYEHSFMMYPMVAIDEINRDDFLLYLEKSGIETRLMLPLLSQPIYQKLFPDKLKNYPVSTDLDKFGFFIGMHQGLTEEDINYISDVFHEYPVFKKISAVMGEVCEH